MSGETLALRFSVLFAGRTDAYGSEEGGCVREKPDYHKHLFGDTPIGVYPVVQGNVLWGCVDFDVKSDRHPSFDYETEADADAAAWELVRVLSHLAITGWVERTRSGGRHVWVFSKGRVAAKAMRRVLLVACEIAEVSSREVNPKQETLSEDQLGNYVRLPYPQADIASRQMLAEPGSDRRIPLDLFIADALDRRSDPEVIERRAKLWRPPPQPTIQTVPYDGDARLNRAGRAVAENGPDDGDRSRGMVYVAFQCMLSGLTPDQAVQILKGMHWNKFAGRADEERRLREIVEAGYR